MAKLSARHMVTTCHIRRSWRRGGGASRQGVLLKTHAWVTRPGCCLGGCCLRTYEGELGHPVSVDMDAKRVRQDIDGPALDGPAST